MCTSRPATLACSDNSPRADRRGCTRGRDDGRLSVGRGRSGTLAGPAGTVLAMRAHWPYLQAYLVRGATCWFAARAVAAVVAWFGSLPALHVSAVAALEAIAVSVLLGIVDTLRRRETALIGNLAIHPIVL